MTIALLLDSFLNDAVIYLIQFLLSFIFRKNARELLSKVSFQFMDIEELPWEIFS